MKILAAAAALFCLTAFSVRSARACTAPSCQPGVQPPTDIVPGNALVIPVGDPATKVSLVGPDGADVPLLLRTLPEGGNALAAAGTLPDGAYTLSFDETCPASNHVTQVIQIGGASDYPATVGSAFIAEAGVNGSVFVFARLSLEADSTFQNFLGLAHIVPEVDGTRVSDFNLADKGWTVNLSAECGPDARSGPTADSCGGISEVTAGHHKVTFNATIAGAPTQPLGASVDVTLDCAWLQSVRPGQPSTPAPATPQTQGQGCAIAGQRSGPFDWVTIAALVLAIALTLRRRARYGCFTTHTCGRR